MVPDATELDDELTTEPVAPEDLEAGDRVIVPETRPGTAGDGEVHTIEEVFEARRYHIDMADGTSAACPAGGYREADLLRVVDDGDDESDDDEPEIMTDGGVDTDDAQQTALRDLAEEGWQDAAREEIAPPLCRWTAGGVSLLLSADGDGEGVPLGVKTIGTSTRATYAVAGSYRVQTETDTHDTTGPHRLRVTDRRAGTSYYNPDEGR